MIYPEHFETKIGFDRVREMLLSRCISELGREKVHSIQFSASYETISTQLDQVEEFRQIILQSIPFPASSYFNPHAVFEHLRLKETFVEADTLLEVKRSYETIIQINNLLCKQTDTGERLYPAMYLLVMNLVIDEGIAKRIDDIVDEKGQIKSNASVELRRIRKVKDDTERKAGQRIQQLLSEGKSQGWISRDAELALRNGRQVLPVPASYKRKIRGFVHDQSATGQTIFLEPEEVFDLNNQVRELEFEERQEIIRILKEFADYLRPLLPEIKACYEMLGHVDAIRAKAKLAIDMHAQKPKLSKTSVINWVRARHPLLYMSFKTQNKHVEPFTATLNQDQRILVISGPNAGGKSVCLKAFGLLQYMLQCGLLVPAEDYSEAGLFDQLFIDIGDEQSLENDLSTYSSHLVNMKYFTTHANTRTLFLIDEFGAGTEPRMGGAIAEAILEKLAATKALGVITTHYANLKLMAGNHEGLLNGSMLFDTKNMKPLFALKTGNPGSSFAFEIAKTIGLQKDILQKAEELTGVQNLDFEKQIQDLDFKKLELEQKEKQLRSADQFLSDLIDKYQGLFNDIEGRKSEILINARKEAKQILSQSNRIIENTIREIRESQAKQEITRKAREDLNTFIEQEEKELKKLDKPKKKQESKVLVRSLAGPIITGDVVRMTGQKSIGEVLEVSGSQAVVLFGHIKLKTPLDKLEKIDKSSLSANISASRVKLSFDINEKAASFTPDIDLRGLRAEEALTRLRTHIDDAIVLNRKQVKILHGKGDGILRTVIRDFLKNIKEVQGLRDEHPDRGGAGATIIDIKL